MILRLLHSQLKIIVLHMDQTETFSPNHQLKMLLTLFIEFLTNIIRSNFRCIFNPFKIFTHTLQFAADSHSEKVTYGDLAIDEEKFLVYVKGVPITLAKKEFELIQLLASKPGKVFTRQEIFNRIWGMDVIVGDRTIDVHIRKIREKIGEDFIKTIKGIGYKFDH